LVEVRVKVKVKVEVEAKARESCGRQVAGYELREARGESGTMSDELREASCELRVTSCEKRARNDE
jgi:hypothetical protein